MKVRTLVAAAALLGTLLPGVCASAADSSALVVVLDASGSMGGRIGRESKMEIARRVLGEWMDGLTDDAEVGLIAYGHRRKGDCGDIETLAPPAPGGRDALKRAVKRLDPKGKTPITDSVRMALDLARDREGGTTVILLSDGLETCGGDPCAAVREAKRQGIEFLLHVVGFDVAKEDVSQLECSAQAGGGLYFSAETAAQLADALRSATALEPGDAAGRLELAASADGRLQDVGVLVFESESGEVAAKARTYAKPETNPRLIPLAAGSYRVEARAVGLEGDVRRSFEIEVSEGSTVRRAVDFSTGEISIGATRNGGLSDALYKVYVAGEREVAATGRTYALPRRNPATLRITAGEYDLTLSSVEMDDHPERAFTGLAVQPQAKIEVSHDWQSGTLRIGAVRSGEPVDALIQVSRASDGETVAQGRAYANPDSNPKDFILQPGNYQVRVVAVRLPGRPSQAFEIELRPGETSSRPADFSP